MVNKAWQRLTAMPAVSSLSADWLLRNIPFVLYLGFVATIYIANTHYAQRTIREIKVIQEDLRELRRVYNALNAEIMYNSKRKQVAESVEYLGLIPSRQAPKKIVIQKGQYD